MQLTRSGGVRAALMNFRNISPGLFLNSADGVVWYLYLLIFIQILPLENMRILQQSHCDKCEGFDLSLKGIKQLYWEYIFSVTLPSWHVKCFSGLLSSSPISPPSRQTRPRKGELKVITIRHHKIVLRGVAHIKLVFWIAFLWKFKHCIPQLLKCFFFGSDSSSASQSVRVSFCDIFEFFTQS